ncbi:hypothetical protein DWF00_05350 [Bosea caraganae]|uniref:Lipopolysaccharide biosynthesis protein n=1 Tax=Bosea caraganae TaxID=2763117 RepID=A0A370L0A4_9HYPH|nr:hypothetical protein [Bosea caraganae]RDJ20694.1 hypothetical protein DWE98_23455 [Bosea caraganae]RDJ28971.1 hypothetical protein DWF00_05350 [Bosea caraganae]
MAAQLTLDGTAFRPRLASALAEPSQRLAAAGKTGFGAGLMLGLRFLQARFLSVWGLLLAAALCPAQVFADFAIFSTLANFVAIAALLRFEAVFFQSNDRRRLGQAFRLALATGAVFLCGMTLAVLFAAAEGWVLRGFGALFMISLASRAVIRLLVAEATAEGDFATVGNINIVQALVQPGMMILLIWPLGATSLALFAADAFGHAVSACYLIWRRRHALIRLVNPPYWSRRELRASAARWRTAPRILLPSALLSFGFMAAPLLALPLAGDPILAAHVALAMRLLEMPTQMFATVSVPLVMNTLRGQAGPDRQQATRIITLRLIVVAAALFAGIGLFAVAADAVLDGTQWQGIGPVVAALALFYGGSALVMPLHEVATLSRYPHLQLVANAVALLAAGVVILWFGKLSIVLLLAIGIISVARMAAHVQFAWTGLGDEPFAAPAPTR